MNLQRTLGAAVLIFGLEILFLQDFPKYIGSFSTQKCCTSEFWELEAFGCDAGHQSVAVAKLCVIHRPQTLTVSCLCVGKSLPAASSGSSGLAAC